MPVPQIMEDLFEEVKIVCTNGPWTISVDAPYRFFLTQDVTATVKLEFDHHNYRCAGATWHT